SALSALSLFKGRAFGNSLRALRLFARRSRSSFFPRGLVLNVSAGSNLCNAPAQPVLQLGDAFARDRRNFVEVQLELFAMLPERRQFLWIRDVHFGRHHHHRLLLQFPAETPQLTHDHVVVVHGIRAAARVGNIYHMRQHAGALNVAQKLHAQSCSLMRALNQPGNIGYDITFFIRNLADGHNTQVGFERGERVVSNLGPRGGDARNQRGFADIGITDQPDIGQQLQLQSQHTFFTRKALFMLARGLMCTGGKVLVAASAAAAMGHDDSLIRPGKIMDLLARIFVVNNGSDWHFEDNALAVATGAVGAFSVTSTLGLVFRIKAEMHQRVVALTGFHNHVAAAAAVAAGGAAARDELLPPKRHAAVAAVTGFDPNYCFINKHALPIDCTRQSGPLSALLPRSFHLFSHFFSAAMRRSISCGDTSSTCVAMVHLCPKGSITVPLRSPSNWSTSGLFTLAPRDTALL